MKSMTLGLCLLMLSGCFIPTSRWAYMTYPAMQPGIMIQPTKWPPIESGLYWMTDSPTRVVWSDESPEDRFDDENEPSKTLE